MLKNNIKAPNFELLSTSKKNYSLKDSIGKYVVIYFYPKDDTPGCTIETNDFNKLLTKFKKLECEIYGISKDSLKSNDKFRDKYKIKLDLCLYSLNFFEMNLIPHLIFFSLDLELAANEEILYSKPYGLL